MAYKRRKSRGCLLPWLGIGAVVILIAVLWGGKIVRFVTGADIIDDLEADLQTAQPPTVFAGTTAAEVMAARDAADRNGVVVLPAYMSRFGSAFGAAREHLLKGALGQLLEISAHFSYDAGSAYPHGSDGAWRWSPEAGGGPLHDIGIYLLFAIREITGQRIATVSFAEANVRRYKKDRPDSIYGWFATENGVPGVMTTTFSHSDMFVRFVGTSGTATLSGAFSQTAAGVLEMETDDLSLRLGSTTAAQRQFDNYRKQVDDFVAVTLGQKSSDISLLDAVEDALVIDAILSSVRMGRACPIDYAVVDKFRA